jgi:uncharacterized protein YndB with AHSA1/START domain
MARELGHRPSHRQPPGYRPAHAAGGPGGDEAGRDQRRDVRRRLVLEASPEQVWRALTDPEELAAWWGDGSELDATPGGEGRFVEEDEPVRCARVVEVRAGQRLVLDWWPEDPDVDEPATRVTIELVPCPFGTIVTVLECALLDLSELPVLVAPRPTFLRPTWAPRWTSRALVGV